VSVLSELARGSMGDINAKGQGILGGYIENQAVLHADTCFSIKENFALLHSYYSDNLKYFQEKPVVHNKRKFSTTQGAPLIVESIGARKHEF
jgi:hypothetical protein